ncbi:MAG: FAD binding domain-containing protein [Anaerolineaceae bacterium]
MWKEYISSSQIEEIIELLAEKKGKARVIAGATDMILELERGARKDIQTIIDISRTDGLGRIWKDAEGFIHMGALVTHNDCAASDLIQEHGLPLALACWLVGSPQIRNRGTVAGNLITASPANDTIPALLALDAQVKLVSRSGERTIALADFYTGVRKTVMHTDELLTDICFKALGSQDQGYYIKQALRKAQAISLVNCAFVLTTEKGVITKASITLGSVAPTIVRATEAEKFLEGKKLDEAVMEEASTLAAKAAKPIDDVRSSARYRKHIVKVIVRRGLAALMNHQEKEGLIKNPVTLRSSVSNMLKPVSLKPGQPIQTSINGLSYTIKNASHKTLLRMLREDVGLTGTKEGCAEGECGACTIFLDGMAVMSCMVPAGRAHQADIVTVEGVSQAGKLHPVQSAFVEEGAVQCGYCTPGFIMSSVKLLEEKPKPSQDDIKNALTGNLCRCTGYYKIIRAVEKAAENKG